MHINKEQSSDNAWNSVRIQEVGWYGGKRAWDKEGGGDMVSRNEISVQFAQSTPWEFSALRWDSFNRNVK